MSVAAAEQQKQHEGQAAYERWIQAELSGDPRLTALRILYNDIRNHGEPTAETWDYFDLQEVTGTAESMDTQHITVLTGKYDPETDEIVAAVAGGERVTYDSFTVSGLERAKERADQNPDFSFQITRDQIYHDNFHGPVKEMWRSETDYDTVLYVSTFPQDLIDVLGERGKLLAQELAYDTEGKKGFSYGFRKNTDDTMEFFATRLGNATPEFFAGYLQKRGVDAADLEGVDSHHYGQHVIKTTTAGQSFKEVARHEATLFDMAAQEITGKRHYFGRDQSGVDAYEVFKQTPKLWGAYREYHKLLAGHFTGQTLHDDLYAYMVTSHESMGAHVLTDHERIRLGVQLDGQKITADMALACKKLMTYAHYATFNRILDEYHRTGRIVDIVGTDIMQAYGTTAGGDGSSAAERGDVFNDCDMTYGEQASTSATDLANSLGISLEEAMRLLNKKQERWSRGECRNCERDTQVWAEEDGGCNVCEKCAKEHTIYGQQGLDRERRRAQAEREVDVRLQNLNAEMEEYLTSSDSPEVGATRYISGQQQMFRRIVTLGSAAYKWVDTATGEIVDDSQA